MPAPADTNPLTNLRTSPLRIGHKGGFRPGAEIREVVDRRELRLGDFRLRSFMSRGGKGEPPTMKAAKAG